MLNIILRFTLILQQGQDKLQSKEEELKARLAALAPEDVARQLRESITQQHAQVGQKRMLDHDACLIFQYPTDHKKIVSSVVGVCFHI